MVKRDSRTIVFDVSSHGFGHLGQIAPVIVELIAHHPTARVVKGVFEDTYNYMKSGQSLYSDKGRPGIESRFVIGLLLLKHGARRPHAPP
jgi:hypothetical protein